MALNCYSLLLAGLKNQPTDTVRLDSILTDGMGRDCPVLCYSERERPMRDNAGTKTKKRNQTR